MCIYLFYIYSTFGKTETHLDPEHPAFYSTCYDVVQGVDFPAGSSTAGAARPPKGSWKYNHNCLSCQDTVSNTVIKVRSHFYLSTQP